MSDRELLAQLTRTDSQILKFFEELNARHTGKSGVLDRVAAEIQAKVNDVCRDLGVKSRTSEVMRSALREAIFAHEKELLVKLNETAGKDEFEKAANLSRLIARTGPGFFLKRDRGAAILENRKPENLLAFLKISNVQELLDRHDITEIFSVLRFMETNEWMHETFDEAYSRFTPDDFEEREVEIKVLGPEWHEVAAKYVAKKHHNVSHLKEFGVIFLNPIGEHVPAKFLRDFALLLHYFHEIEFYSRLFRRYAKEENFSHHLKALLRGDVREAAAAAPGEWLIVQRYLFKEDPMDPRLFVPRVNPESIHWRKGELDLAAYGKEQKMGLAMWGDLDWVGAIAEDDGRLVSFDLEDNAMSAVNYIEGRTEHHSYHQREALWTKIFREYVGGDAEATEKLLEKFTNGVLSF